MQNRFFSKLTGAEAQESTNDPVPIDTRTMAHAERHFRNLLVKVAEEQGYRNPQIEVNQLPNVGANFTSLLFVATISASGKDDLELFGKVAAVSEELRAMTPLQVFEAEGYFYEHLLATYKKLEVDHDVPIEERLITPAFYGFHPTVGEETIILENLKSNGFGTLDRFDVFTWEYVTKAVKELAKFHALSFAFAKEDPEKYAENVERFKFDWEMMETMAPIMKGMMEEAVAAVSEDNRLKFAQFVKTLESEENIVKYYAGNTVLKHGDFRASNLMHKLDEDGNLKVVPIDYQTIQAGDPITDLLYLIFTGTDAAFRKENWQRLMDFYYEQLAAAMTRLGVDPEETYSREHFDQSLKEMLPYGLIVAMSILSMVMTEAPPTVGADLKLEDLFSMKAGEVYKERLNGIIRDYVEWGVL